MHSAPTLVCPAASAAGSPMPSCEPSHSCGAGRNRYIASSPAYSQRRVNVTMDHAIATPLFPVITLQPLCFMRLRTLFRNGAPLSAGHSITCALFRSSLGAGTLSLAGTGTTVFCSAFVFILLRIALPATSSLSQPPSLPGGGDPTLGARTPTASNVQFVRSATWTRRAHPTIIAARSRFQVHG